MTNLSTNVTASLVVPTAISASILPGLTDPIAQQGAPLNGSSSSGIDFSTGVTKLDFNGDGRDDLFWYNNKTGDTGIWLSNGAAGITPLATGNVPVDSLWKVVGFGDFSGDGKTDVLWQNSSTGDVGLWNLTPENTVQYSLIATIDPGSNWQIQGFFDDGGKAGIYWANSTTGQYGEWHLSGTQLLSAEIISAPLQAVTVSAPTGSTYAANLGGSVQYDGFQYNTPTRQLSLLVNNGGSTSATVPIDVVPAGWDIVSLGAYTGNGITNPLFESSTGDYGFWSVSSNGQYTPTLWATVAPDSGWTIVNSLLSDYLTVQIPCPG